MWPTSLNWMTSIPQSESFRPESSILVAVTPFARFPRELPEIRLQQLNHFEYDEIVNDSITDHNWRMLNGWLSLALALGVMLSHSLGHCHSHGDQPARFHVHLHWFLNTTTAAHTGSADQGSTPEPEDTDAIYLSDFHYNSSRNEVGFASLPLLTDNSHSPFSTSNTLGDSANVAPPRLFNPPAVLFLRHCSWRL